MEGSHGKAPLVAHSPVTEHGRTVVGRGSPVTGTPAIGRGVEENNAAANVDAAIAIRLMPSSMSGISIDAYFMSLELWFAAKHYAYHQNFLHRSRTCAPKAKFLTIYVKHCKTYNRGRRHYILRKMFFNIQICRHVRMFFFALTQYDHHYCILMRDHTKYSTEAISCLKLK